MEFLLGLVIGIVVTALWRQGRLVVHGEGVKPFVEYQGIVTYLNEPGE